MSKRKNQGFMNSIRHANETPSPRQGIAVTVRRDVKGSIQLVHFPGEPLTLDFYGDYKLYDDYPIELFENDLDFCLEYHKAKKELQEILDSHST